MIAGVILAGTMLASIPYAAASDLASLKNQIESATTLRDAAHELADNARLLGAEEHGPVIQFAKEQWIKHQENVKLLQKEYRFAEARDSATKAPMSLPLGTFRISFYCPCSKCNGSSNPTTASGAPLTVGKTIAVDPKRIPLGTDVFIEGIGWRTAQDTGGAIKGNKIDVLVSSHKEAYAKGVVYRDVFK